jgi:serine/threonine protein kinase
MTIGDTISHYKIMKKLGEGGMGVVYKAEDTKLKRTVALKFLPPAMTRDREAKERFINEAQAAAALEHPNICTIYEIDEFQEQMFIAMSYIEGEDLKDKISKGPVKLNETITIGIQIAAGLNEAHRKGIVHRDIKPGNVMLTATGQAIIMDFGLAKTSAQLGLTKTGTVMGTTSYMSPEQAQGEKVDLRSDIWALGIILYEMISGQSPFPGDYPEAVIYSIQNEEPEPLTALRTGVPMELERIVVKALSKNPDHRYQHTDELIADLERLKEETKVKKPKSQAVSARVRRPPVKRSSVKAPSDLPGQVSLGSKAKTLGISVFLFSGGWILLMLLLMVPFIGTLYETIESFIYYQIFIPSAHPHEHLLIIDEEDVSYNREEYARLLSGLDRSGAKVIALDVLFTGTKDPMQDSLLVSAVQAAPHKIINAVEFINRDNHAIIPDGFQVRFPEKPSQDRFVDGAIGALLPFEHLLGVTIHLGHISGGSDLAYSSQLYFPLLIYFNNRVYPSLPLLAVMNYLDCSKDTTLEYNEDGIVLHTQSMTLSIPTDYKAQTLINFIPQSKFAGKILSMEEALDRLEKKNEIFNHKIVIVGNTFDSQEQTQGPHFQRYPNLFIYASLISQILHGQNIREGILESILISLAFVIIGTLYLMTLPHRIHAPWSKGIYLIAFLLFFAADVLLLGTRTRIYIILPYVVFCLTYMLTKKYYLHKTQDVTPY